MTTFLEDWHHQGSGPVSRDSASIQRSLKMIWRMGGMASLVVLSIVALIAAGSVVLWVFRGDTNLWHSWMRAKAFVW